jgi:hypothetical protein
MKNSRERQIRKSRKLVTDEQLIAILHALREQGRRDPFALAQIDKALRAGQSLDQIFYTGTSDGFSLNITRQSDSRLKIELSWSFLQTEPDGTEVGEGDGGTWFVEIDDAGGLSITPDIFWMS